MSKLDKIDKLILSALQEDARITNLDLAKKVGGSVIISPNDDHRLNKSLRSDILQSAVLTAIELNLK